MATLFATKSKKRELTRYEKRYSNAMWHADWHIMRDHDRWTLMNRHNFHTLQADL